MNFWYDNLEIQYKFIDNNKKLNTIILPGWLQNSKTYEILFDVIGKYSNIYVLELPGFLITKEPNKAVTLDYYVDILKLFIKTFKINNYILFGHSFGCRVIIKYQAIYNEECYLILTGAAGIRRFNLRRSLKILRYKIKKHIYKKINKSKYLKLIKSSGSKDYQSLSFTMKETFKNIIKEDLRKYLKKINSLTILIWGQLDKETPLNDGFLMKKNIRNSYLFTLEYAGHFAFLDKPLIFKKILDSFYISLKGE